jgi:hypothetical protein
MAWEARVAELGDTVESEAAAQNATQPTASGAHDLLHAADWRRALASERALGCVIGSADAARVKPAEPISRMDDALRAIRAEIARSHALVSCIERRQRFEPSDAETER